PASDLLLPYFELDLESSGVTTLFAVGNAAAKPVDVLATLHTNWGIAILEVPFTLQPNEIRTVNLRDWFHTGGDPKKIVAPAELEHLAAAVSGQASPKDKMYYSSEVQSGRAVGSVTLRSQGSRPEALWGDWFVVDSAGNLARGDVLVDIGSATDRSGLCRRHLLRYLSGGGFDGGTEVIVWREAVGKPSASPDGADRGRLLSKAAVFSEPGLAVEDRELALLPLEKISVTELGLQEPFGALDIETEEATFIEVQHTAENRYSVAFQAHCLASACDENEPALALEILLNGQPAGTPRGILVEASSQLVWTLMVANTSQTAVSDIRIDGLAASCPRSELEAGELMACTATSTALSGMQSVPVSATGRTSCDSTSTSAAGFYEGTLVDVFSVPAIQIVTRINGDDANLPPGPSVAPGSPLLWTYEVGNIGDVGLQNVQVTDDQGAAVSCPKTTLTVGESMICTRNGIAQACQHASVGTASGADIPGQTASASDPSHYFGLPGSGDCPPN
ncbi:MAG TPA: hypothetical protein VE078_00190, partial [Thermoanaerobaculia bacterium]|nr:hypothetical protein [Thermoanaerobaculia bacterium]